MAGSESEIGVSFEYDGAYDFYIVYPCGHLRTPEDVRVWADTLDAFYAPRGNQTDAIIVLDMFLVDPSVKQLYQQHRERVTKLYLRHCVIVNCNPGLMDARNTSFAHANFAADILTAIELIHAKRGSEVRREPDLALRDAAGAGPQTISHPVVGIVEPEHGRGR